MELVNDTYEYLDLNFDIKLYQDALENYIDNCIVDKVIKDPVNGHIIYIFNEKEETKEFVEWYKLFLLLWNGVVVIMKSRRLSFLNFYKYMQINFEQHDNYENLIKKLKYIFVYGPQYKSRKRKILVEALHKKYNIYN